MKGGLQWKKMTTLMNYELLADEINAMMEVDILCKLTDLSVQDEGDGEDEEEEAINSKREQVSFDEVNAFGYS